MIIWLYRASFAFAAVFILPLLAIFNRKVRRGLGLRMQRRLPPRFSFRPLWIHAASGEFEYAKPLIRELKARFPELPIVVTYFSPSFAMAVENFPGVDFAQPLPLDLPGPCSAFLKRFSPRALLIARTDFWPEILYQTRSHKIPIHVFSYTQKAGAQGWLTRFRLQLCDLIQCVSLADQEALQNLGNTTLVQVLGDTRYDQVRHRLRHPKPIPESLKPQRLCLVAGSTWPEDERVLLPALTPALKSGKLQLILVPHEPTESHIESLRRELRLLGLSYALYSSQQAWTDKDVLLVDKIGVLAELYLWGNLAFVGGSFRKSVHSVMEALGAGCMTFVGPKHEGNREAMEFQQLAFGDTPFLQVVQDSQAFSERIENVLKQPERLVEFKKALISEFDRRLGASHRLIESLQPVLNPR